ncbi:1-acylglycerol-3-phosphate O-acyltransferase [Helicobacter ailurogastricus]|uniref:1-acyl-sn-glycerol-3-phosphate acyltransferase n=1 Tax=Helicobacter ailurogastricus TaxID=1578720 RepID=A0A0K2XDY1_9HELI|nr:1-acylglycerol-3-phosphate O-acyltransferase [Helicobacter ailurogastricus]CRF40659.1 1-acyl-sn-glycerol-3-phosphate acyltransferase [Helicobacter ailurogastricus]CRF43052.1 1-acyl-sn-glycerol-3-phosphate acyltransferase [Helicobacter ailurogastricus]CRF44281.1 1-acyl-sn-glycerol-3-phosphate acyltransferase [Helicobacter ailurogastricus]CRF52248.1 1-acyl-sn-glycerol-3-phosphate acyltransferase [Helicobacter ailurogastricus]GLH57446.1 1-acyl-sn-glycerol-3-phosphate acyltransferase PlsC [Heli
MWSKIRGIYALLVVGLGLGFIILMNFLTRKRNNSRQTRKWCRSFFPLMGSPLEKVGEFDLSADLIVLNHQSIIDIICLEAYHPRNICWIAKKELGDIPYYGYALKTPQMILIDREDRRGLASLIKIAKEKLEQDRPLVIFPEGTRGRGAEKFLPFKPGARVLAEKLHLKIQPILLFNTRKIFNTKPIESQATHLRMVLMPAFTPDLSTDWYAKLEQDMQAEYNKHYQELNG